MCWCFSDDLDIIVVFDWDFVFVVFWWVEFDVIIFDFGFLFDFGGVIEGFELLEEIFCFVLMIKVIVVIGCEDKDNVVKVIGMGVCDFYQKLLDVEILIFVVYCVFCLVEFEWENQDLVN